MARLIKQGGVWAPAPPQSIKTGGVWTPVQKSFIKTGGAWTQFYANEIVVTISANASQINASSYFSPTDWAADTPKRIITEDSANIWSYTPGTPALNCGTGRGGTLIIDNAGYVLGAGGNNNSGAGGDAIYVPQSGVTINNAGWIYGGGGGGGVGGQGGPGYYQTPYTYTEAGSYVADSSPSGGIAWQYGWVGAETTNGNGVSSGGWFYYKGAYTGSGYHPFSSYGGSYFTTNDYQGYRQQTRYNTYYTTGGAGGTGGHGTGHNSSLVNLGSGGAAGAGGGTNAGAGGTGGAGAGWGAAGASGATGASGNNGGGSAGAAGGSAGRYLNGVANCTFNNTGTVLGLAA